MNKFGKRWVCGAAGVAVMWTTACSVSTSSRTRSAREEDMRRERERPPLATPAPEPAPPAPAELRTDAPAAVVEPAPVAPALSSAPPAVGHDHPHKSERGRPGITHDGDAKHAQHGHHRDGPNEPAADADKHHGKHKSKGPKAKQGKHAEHTDAKGKPVDADDSAEERAKHSKARSGDHDRGHGNDRDGVDEDNPGKSKRK
jgi:hypothetical protein